MAMEMVRNIVDTYRRATAEDFLTGLAFYSNAHEFASQAQTVEIGAGIISALSPRMPWHRNLALARLAFTQPLTGGALGNSIRKANAIRDGGDIYTLLKTPKTASFYSNIMYPLSSFAVTVDVHAIRVAGITGRDSLTPKQYHEVAEAYRQAAYIVGLRALALQAITWTTYRREQDIWTHHKD